MKEQLRTIDDLSINNGFYDAPTVICIFAQNNFMFKTADAFCMAENLILQATELGIAGRLYVPVFCNPWLHRRRATAQ